MIDHVTFAVTDFTRSTAFYDQALRPLGVTRLVDVSPEETGGVRVSGYGDDCPWFWLANETPTRGMLHIALSAKSQTDVEAFHTAALQAGGTDNGAPGLRPQYGEGYYAAFVLDPDGHNIEAVFRLSVERTA